MLIRSTTRIVCVLKAAAFIGAIGLAGCNSTSPTNAAPPPVAHNTAAAPSPSGASQATTSDGLQLVKTTANERVYVRPGASLKPYSKFAILNCFVSFAPHWQEDMQTNFNIPITDAQVAQTKAQIAAEFKDVFVSQLEQGGFPLVNDAAPGVLVLRPALINVYIAAPQNMEDPNEVTITNTTGQLTLYLELYDAVSNQLLARVIDAESASATDGLFMWQTRAGNITAGREVMTQWADTLRHYMEAARGVQ